MLVDVGYMIFIIDYHWTLHLSKSPSHRAVRPLVGDHPQAVAREGEALGLTEMARLNGEWGYTYIYIYIYIPHMFFFPRYYEDMKILFNICVNKYVYLMMFFPYVVHVCPVDMAIHWTGLVAFIPAVTPDGDR